MSGDPSQRPAEFERKLDAVARLVAELIECSDPRECERLLLEAVFVLGAAGAGAIWRRGGTRWLSVLERGPRELLPSQELVAAVLQGALSHEVLPPGAAVLRAGSGDGALALVLGEAEGSEEHVDVLEALLHVARALGASGISLRDPQFPAQPRRRRADGASGPDPH